MIRKPSSVERESRAHAAVGKAIEIGGDVRDASQKGGRLLSKGCLIYFGVAMLFGLLVSSTPLWFKGLVLLFGYGAYRLIRAVVRRLGQAAQAPLSPTGEMLKRSGSIIPPGV